jgi:hypothetical protein
MTGKLVPVTFDQAKLTASFTEVFNTMADFALWAVKRWNKGCRETDFLEWRRKALKGIGRLKAEGIGSKCVDVETVKPIGLVTTHRYIRRNPMGRVNSLHLDKETGIVSVKYWERGEQDGWSKRPGRFGIVEFMARLIGQDGRSTRIEYLGAYRSGQGRKRDQKVSGIYDELKVIKDVEMSVWRNRNLKVIGNI